MLARRVPSACRSADPSGRPLRSVRRWTPDGTPCSSEQRTIWSAPRLIACSTRVFIMSSVDDDRDPQEQRLERMKNDFLVAQRRRRERTPVAALRHDDGGDGPPLAGPAPDGLT